LEQIATITGEALIMILHVIATQCRS